MNDEKEFRIGDVPARGLTDRVVPRAEPGGIDKQTFPTLSAFLEAPPALFRSRVDSLAARARSAQGDLQGALQAAVRVLPGIYKLYGG